MMPAAIPPSVPACVVQAATDYSLPLRALLAVGLTEGGHAGTVSRNRNGTSDHGPFQINTTWVTLLQAQFGVTAEQLTHDLCWSARAAAYILRYEINAANGSFWDGIGHYHSHTPSIKAGYIERVYKNSLLF
ncbi:MAG: lytic transglycosylase domain-containing protein [Pseudomonadota bacterium]